MPYVKRDANGVIVGTFALEQYPGQEFISSDDAGVLDHLGLSLEKVKARKRISLRNQAKTGLNAELNEWDGFLAVAIARGIQSGQITNATQINRFDAVLTGMVTAFGGVNSCLGLLETSAAAVDNWVIDKYRPALQAVNNATTVEEVLAINL